MPNATAAVSRRRLFVFSPQSLRVGLRAIRPLQGGESGTKSAGSTFEMQRVAKGERNDEIETGS
jgi:hypothetical protein